MCEEFQLIRKNKFHLLMVESNYYINLDYYK